MLEKDVENLIAQNPDEIFPGEGFKLIKQQYTAEGKRIDILFEDKHNRKIIVEVKRGILSREASGQVAEYCGLLKSQNKSEYYELVLCANVIPRERKLFLENIGIECKELGIAFVSKLAARVDYIFLDDRPSEKIQQSQTPQTQINNNLKEDEDVSVWIFQANPHRYDILNALSDKHVGNRIHWLVNQNKKKILKGHLGFIWMSGKDSGIYALTRIETNPAVLEEFPSERKYWLDTGYKEQALRVQMTALRRYINKPILKENVLEVPGLSDMAILRQPQGTNFPVKSSEWLLLSNLLH